MLHASVSIRSYRDTLAREGLYLYSLRSRLRNGIDYLTLDVTPVFNPQSLLWTDLNGILNCKRSHDSILKRKGAAWKLERHTLLLLSYRNFESHITILIEKIDVNMSSGIRISDEKVMHLSQLLRIQSRISNANGTSSTQEMVSVACSTVNKPTGASAYDQYVVSNVRQTAQKL